MINLPIDSLEQDIMTALKGHNTLILQAPPGSGKTTRVPQFLRKSLTGKILVLEPRRLAARLSAERVAEELNQSVGNEVGFQIRFERVAGPNTRVMFMTEGLFLRTLLAEPTLNGIDCVVLDEFHERHMHSDVAFALARWLQGNVRPDLKLILMSATLDTERLIERIPDAALLKADVPTYPVEIDYDTAPDERPLEWRVAVAVEALLQDPRCPGDVLVFLTGAADIRRSAAALSQSKLKNLFDIFELRADLAVAEQRKIFQPHPRRKVILSTNVAETSVTIPGVTGVVDSGLAKMASYAHWNGLPTLDIKSISQASAIQRAGRAGRTAAGVARRLYTRSDFHGRANQEKPEIQRMDLTQTMLEMLVAGKRIIASNAPAFEDHAWLDTPPDESIHAALALLQELGALDSAGQPTPLAEKLVRLPLHPRLGRIVAEAEQTGHLPEACLLVSLLNEGFISKRSQQDAALHTDCDLVYQAQLFQRFLHAPDSLSRNERESIDVAQLKRVEKSFDSLCHLNHIKKNRLELVTAHESDCSPFAREIISGFPDRLVALRKTKGSTKALKETIFARGGLGQLANSSTVQDSAFGIALQAEQVRRQGSIHFTTEVTIASGLSATFIKKALAKRVRSEKILTWDESTERVRCIERTLVDSLILDEKQIPAEQSAVEQLLFQQLKIHWPKPFPDERPLEFFQQRTRLLRQRFTEIAQFDLSGDDFELFLVHICEGKRSFTEIIEQDLQEYIDTFIPWDLKSLLEKELPVKIALNSGRKVEVNYVDGQPPWLSSRMQDFFGTMETPKLLQGSLPVTVHLLAPNGQSVQVTTDLAGFWKNTYPDVKKELSRRYPRHYWPDDPRNAEPLTRRPKQGQTQAGTSQSK
ncbi:ATP-dependent helicase HrpB [bacterium]|nr:ATP-dependent helicase HrpB [bacterium]